MNPAFEDLKISRYRGFELLELSRFRWVNIFVGNNNFLSDILAFCLHQKGKSFQRFSGHLLYRLYSERGLELRLGC